MRVALDSNVMIYAEGAGDEVQRRRALSLIAAIRASDLRMPLQAVGETLRWLVTKGRLTRHEVLFSEDMHDGFRWRGVTIINPFTDDHPPVVRELLTKIRRRIPCPF